MTLVSLVWIMTLMSVMGTFVKILDWITERSAEKCVKMVWSTLSRSHPPGAGWKNKINLKLDFATICFLGEDTECNIHKCRLGTRLGGRGGQPPIYFQTANYTLTRILLQPGQYTGGYIPITGRPKANFVRRCNHPYFSTQPFSLTTFPISSTSFSG